MEMKYLYRYQTKSKSSNQNYFWYYSSNTICNKMIIMIQRISNGGIQRVKIVSNSILFSLWDNSPRPWTYIISILL